VSLFSLYIANQRLDVFIAKYRNMTGFTWWMAHKVLIIS
jgi:hypothetical protein